MVVPKAISRMNRQELNDAVDQKKALPDMVLKRIFFNAQENMTNAESNLMLNYYKNQGFFVENDVYRFRSSILTCFRLISGMIYEAKVMNWYSKEKDKIHKINRVSSDYELCVKLTRYSMLDVPTLIHLAGYLNYCLHELGLTNLLIDNKDHEIELEDLF